MRLKLLKGLGVILSTFLGTVEPRSLQLLRVIMSES